MNKLIGLLRHHKKFLVSTHVSPDPDALCSLLALGNCLRLLGKKVFLVIEEPVPARYEFLPEVKTIKSLSQVKTLDYDVAIVADCGELNRIGKVAVLLKRNKPLINIDHHITNDLFGTVNLVDAASSSTAEVLCDLFKKMRVKLNKHLAANLYIGIMTDTGSFRFENTTAKTHSIVAELMRFGIPVYEVYKKLYEMVPLSDMKSFVDLINQFEVFGNGKVICLTLSKAMQNKFTEEFDLRDTVFKFLRSIQGIEAFVILTQKDANLTRVNLRSSGKMDVAKIAQEFEGGGHRMASGCQLPTNVTKAKKKIVEAILRKL